MRGHGQGVWRRAALLCSLLLAGCGGGVGRYHADEEFQNDSRYRREYPVTAERLCDSVRDVLMGQGYVVVAGDPSKPLSLVGQKEFRKDDDKYAVLQIHATCRPGSVSALLYTTAVESHFESKKGKSTAPFGVNIPVLSNFPFGIAGKLEDILKTGGETVRDAAFYDRFFKAVSVNLGLR
jgi:hypothetical protein